MTSRRWFGRLWRRMRRPSLGQLVLASAALHLAGLVAALWLGGVPAPLPRDPAAPLIVELPPAEPGAPRVRPEPAPAPVPAPVAPGAGRAPAPARRPMPEVARPRPVPTPPARAPEPPPQIARPVEPDAPPPESPPTPVPAPVLAPPPPPVPPTVAAAPEPPPPAPIQPPPPAPEPPVVAAAPQPRPPAPVRPTPVAPPPESAVPAPSAPAAPLPSPPAAPARPPDPPGEAARPVAPAPAPQDAGRAGGEGPRELPVGGQQFSLLRPRIEAPRLPGPAPRGGEGASREGDGAGALGREREGQAAIPLNTPDPRFQDYFQEIKKRLEASWVYPAEASRRGQSGQLVAEIVVRRDGSVPLIELVHSSGVEILDRYALNAVRFASPFPAIPDRITLDRIPITITFTYVLDNGLRVFGLR